MAYPDQFRGLRDKKVLVTGASGGIGSSIAELFASSGAYVGIHYNTNKKKAEELLMKITKNGGKALLIQGDLHDQRVKENLIKNFIEMVGGIDILINNAGFMEKYVHFSEITEDDWDRSYSLNTKAPFFLMSSAMEYMKDRGGGKIINISSANVPYGGSARSFHYVSTKAALDNLTIGFSRYGAKHNILVNSVRSGLIDTGMRKKTKGYNEENFNRRVQLIPLKRTGYTSDISEMVLFLASESGNFITGEVFTVAGGD